MDNEDLNEVNVLELPFQYDPITNAVCCIYQGKVIPVLDMVAGLMPLTKCIPSVEDVHELHESFGYHIAMNLSALSTIKSGDEYALKMAFDNDEAVTLLKGKHESFSLHFHKEGDRVVLQTGGKKITLYVERVEDECGE